MDQTLFYNKQMAAKLNVADYDGKGRELDIKRVKRYQEWKACEKDTSQNPSDPRMCVPPWASTDGDIKARSVVEYSESDVAVAGGCL